MRKRGTVFVCVWSQRGHMYKCCSVSFPRFSSYSHICHSQTGQGSRSILKRSKSSSLTKARFPHRHPPALLRYSRILSLGVVAGFEFWHFHSLIHTWCAEAALTSSIIVRPSRTAH
jgi:hypothetical protein